MAVIWIISRVDCFKQSRSFIRLKRKLIKMSDQSACDEIFLSVDDDETKQATDYLEKPDVENSSVGDDNAVVKADNQLVKEEFEEVPISSDEKSDTLQSEKQAIASTEQILKDDSESTTSTDVPTVRRSSRLNNNNNL